MIDLHMDLLFCVGVGGSVLLPLRISFKQLSHRLGYLTTTKSRKGLSYLITTKSRKKERKME